MLILGTISLFWACTTNPNLKGRSLATVLAEAMAVGQTGAELQAIEDNWLNLAQLKSFCDCVKDAINRMNVGEGEKQMRLNQWEKHYSYDKGLSNEQAREVAERLGIKNPFGVGTCLEQEKVSIGSKVQ